MQPTHATCTVDGCDKPLRSARATLCAMHYHRLYRHGSVDKVATHVTVKNASQYRSVSRPGHPLANKNGKLHEHRLVLFTAIGDGWHDCHWCGRRVRWMHGTTDPDRLQVDHVNGVKDDNRPDNLVPSCSSCNVARSLQARSATLRAAGFWSGQDTVARLTKPGRRDTIRPNEAA